MTYVRDLADGSASGGGWGFTTWGVPESSEVALRVPGLLGALGDHARLGAMPELRDPA